MECWSAQRSDYRSPLVELANTTNSVKGKTKRGVIVQSPRFRRSPKGAAKAEKDLKKGMKG
jgi:hypothetical protein